MDSDTDHFESADEEFTSDNEENIKQVVQNQIKATDNSNVIPVSQVENITLQDSALVKDNKDSEKREIEKIICNKTENSTSTKNENDVKTNQKQKTRVIERKERPQKIKTKLGTKISENKDDIFKENFEEVTKSEIPKSVQICLELNKTLLKDKSDEATKYDYTKPLNVQECWEVDDDEIFKEKCEGATKYEYIKPPNVQECWEVDDDDIFKERFEETKNEYTKSSNVDVQECWEVDNGVIKPRILEKSSPNKNFWENDKTADEEASNNWSSWGNWGVSSFLSTAQLGVSTITNSVSQGITTVLESGIGVPDPEQLARIDMEDMKKQKDISPEKEQKIPTEIQENKEKQDGLFGLGNLVSGVSHITKLVETTGTKVLAGGLDTLETIGKKTFEALQEGDPGLKKKRALFKIGQDKPILSQILREAKEKAEQENKLQQITKKPQYETIFDDYQGLVHLEALEMLSKQCDIKLDTLMNTLQGDSLQDIQETMVQIKELCELPDEEEDSTVDVESVREKIDSALSEMNISISYTHFLDTWVEIEKWLETDEKNEDNIHQKAIESLAQLTAIAVEQFHKAAELMLVKERRSTVDEADSLVQLTITLTGIIGAVAGKFSEKLSSLESQNVNNFITNIFLEAANSSSYIQDAFNLMIPILQVGAV